MKLVSSVLVKAMALIASQLSGHPLLDSPPQAYYVSEAEMEVVCSCNDAAGLYRAGGNIYINIEYLKSKYNRDDETVRDVLVHELTHWIQWRSGVWKEPWGSCESRQNRENEAYMIENRYIGKYERLRNGMVPRMVIPPTFCKSTKIR